MLQAQAVVLVAQAAVLALVVLRLLVVVVVYARHYRYLGENAFKCWGPNGAMGAGVGWVGRQVVLTLHSIENRK